MGKHLAENEQKEIARLYESRLEEYGRDHRTVGWGSVEEQILRFEILTRDLVLKGKTILDVGCGLGDMVPYINGRTEGDFKYIGIDIAKTLIDSARAEYSSRSVQFFVGDIFEVTALDDLRDLLATVEICVLSGALSFRIRDNEGYARSVVGQMFQLSSEACAANFLSSYVDYVDDKNYHYQPEKIFSFCKTMSPWVALYHDYPLWEFTIQIRRNAYALDSGKS